MLFKSNFIFASNFYFCPIKKQYIHIHTNFSSNNI